MINISWFLLQHKFGNIPIDVGHLFLCRYVKRLLNTAMYNLQTLMNTGTVGINFNLKV